MANEQNLKPFKKNDGENKDPRINRRGRSIRGIDALRKEWQNVWAEIMFDSNGKPIIDDVTGKALTRLQARMRIATSSRNPAEFKTALEYAYGKVKDEVDVTSDGKAITEIKVDDERYNRAIASLAETIREAVSNKNTE